MTNTYNTGNALGSTDPRDLLDNASNLDDAMNSELPTFVDRLGVTRDTYSGQENQFNTAQTGRQTQFQQFLTDSGYVSLGNYAAGVSFTAYNQYMARSGFFYRPAASSIPFVTSGTWVADDEDLFVLFSQDDLLRQELADDTDPLKGTALIGYNGGTLADFLADAGGDTRTIESFGPVDTPANTKATLQTAIDYCAANNKVLTALGTEFIVDYSSSSNTIPSNFRCRLRGVTIKRATGNTTPNDMWINADTVGGNTGIYIEGVRFDGQRTVDSLSSVNVGHRFCGLRLVNCAAGLVDVRADNTVNAEVQVEGTRAAIMLSDSQLVVCRGLYADGNNGTGFIAENGVVSVDGAWFYNNTGSGLSVRNCDDSYFNNCNNDTSGYSGLSFNAARLRISNLKSVNTPLGYAGINIGHSSAASQAPNCVAVNLRVSQCAGWGIFVNYANNLCGANWIVDDSATRGIHIVDSLGVRIKNLRSRLAATNDLLVTGSTTAWVDVDFQGSQSSSIQATGTASVYCSESSVIDDPCQSASGTIAGVLANAGTRIKYAGEIKNSDRYGAVSSGAGAVVDLSGATITGSAVGPTLEASGGVIRYAGSKFSTTDHTSGSFTIAAAGTSAVVNNGNVIDGQRIVFTPTNSEARLGAVPIVASIVQGVSFTASIGAATTNARTYSYVLL